MVAHIIAEGERLGCEHPEDWILELIAEGWSIAKVAREKLDGIASRHMLHQYLTRDEEAKDLLYRAREAGAGALVEEGLDIADAAVGDPTPGAAQIAKLRIDQRNFIAGHHDRARYGKQTSSPSAPISIGELHLQVLQVVGEGRKALPVPEGEAVEVEEEGEA